jgi:hypothetical protein
VSNPQVHQNLLFLKKGAVEENGKTKIENIQSATTLWRARRLLPQEQYERT